VIRAVLDTNTIVSGLGWGGTPGAVLDAALAGRFEIVTGDQDLLTLSRIDGIRILPPRAFLEALQHGN
jgi:predicted nucleic acid-binding protein